MVVETVEDCQVIWPYICDYADDNHGDVEKMSSLEGKLHYT